MLNALLLAAGWNLVRFGNALRFPLPGEAFDCLYEGFHGFHDFSCAMIAPCAPSMKAAGTGATLTVLVGSTRAGSQHCCGEVKSCLFWLQWEFCDRWQSAELPSRSSPLFSLVILECSREAIAFWLPLSLLLFVWWCLSLQVSLCALHKHGVFEQIGVKVNVDIHWRSLCPRPRLQSEPRKIQLIGLCRECNGGCIWGILTSASANYQLSDGHSVCAAAVYSLIQPFLAPCTWSFFCAGGELFWDTSYTLQPDQCFVLNDSDKWEVFDTSFTTWKMCGAAYQNLCLISSGWKLVQVGSV